MANIQFAKNKEKSYQPKKRLHKILIVDDEQSIHDITDIAIRSMVFSDFTLEILSAYSAAEAKEVLHQHPDISLAFIDVVMETPEAGLELAEYIRGSLSNEMIRLIIRTGQANEFPAMEVIQRYDINDFKEKTELTLERLYTTIRSSIKQYEQLLELQKKYEETYTQMTTNTLTKLPNRMKLNEDFAEDEYHKTLILIDIIGFSVINESNGYEIGDFVLKELGGFLSSMYSETFEVYHLHSDLFALVAPENSLDNLEESVERIKDDISKLHMITNNFNKTIETTIGVAYQSDNNIMRKAELALKEARNTGKNKIKYYSNDLKIIKRIKDTNYWAPIVKEGLLNGNMMAYYQAIYDLKTNKIDKYELLARLKHEGKVHAPIHFLEAAEYSGQLSNLFRFMFTKGCEMAAQTGMRFSVNISDTDFLSEGVYEFIDTSLKENSVEAGRMSLEILENNSIDKEEDILNVVSKIHALGVEIVIDDFGVNCSNFGQIECLPVDVIKIDGSFIKNLATSANSNTIVKTIKTFAKEKDIKLVAEFVCDNDVYDIVKDLGIDYAQGYYLAEPSAEI